MSAWTGATGSVMAIASIAGEDVLEEGPAPRAGGGARLTPCSSSLTVITLIARVAALQVDQQIGSTLSGVGGGAGGLK
jgi:hypothetical protein